MIYAEKQQEESPFVSVNTITRGRVLPPTKKSHGINTTPPYQVKKQAEQSRAPAAELQEDEALKAEKDLSPDKDTNQESTQLQTKTKAMTATASGMNTGTSAEPGLESKDLSSPQGSGQPLPDNLRPKMEETLGMDFTDVRLHYDTKSATMAQNLGANAFTHREDIYFNQGAYQPETAAGEQLLAHELTHVKQQRARARENIPGLQTKLQEPMERERYEQEADAVADTVAGASYQPMGNSDSASVSAQSAGGAIQLAKAEQKADENNNSSWLLEKVSGLVRNIPGYDLLALAIGHDPLTGRGVKGDGLAWGKALTGLIPGGAVLFANMEKAGVIARAVAWLQQEIQQLGITFTTIKNLFDQAWTTVVGNQSPKETPEPEKKGWFDRFAEGVKDFGTAVANVGKALLSPEETFNKIKQIFLPPINRIIGFVGQAGPKLMEFTFEGALTLAKAPVKKIMEIFNKGKGVLRQIISDPVGFLKNLLQAIHGGLQNFRDKIGIYLQSGLAGWLFGALSNAGITLPQKLNVSGIFSLIAQILGVTWQAIKTRVIKLLGPKAEKVMGQVEKGVAVVTDLITKGPVALYEMAIEFIGDLKTRFFTYVIEWVRNTIIVKGVEKLILLFNPVGAIVQAAITISNTIKFFIDRAKQVAAFANAVFDSVTEIAGGNLKKAITAVENSLAKALPVAIGFMANLAGIGGIVAKIKDVIKSLRKPIDKAVEKVVGVVADRAQAFMAKLTGADKPKEEPPKNQKEHDGQVEAGLAALDNEQKKKDQDNDGALTYEEAEEAAERVKQVYPIFKLLAPIEKGAKWIFRYVASPVRDYEGYNVEKPRGIRKNEITTYEDFVDRSIVGDNLEGHEIWQHANLKAKGLAKQRLSTEASRKNPVIALEGSKHIKINSAQRAINAFYQSARQNIEANIRILSDNGIPQKKVNELARKAVKHAKELGEME